MRKQELDGPREERVGDRFEFVSGRMSDGQREGEPRKRAGLKSFGLGINHGVNIYSDKLPLKPKTCYLYVVDRVKGSRERDPSANCFQCSDFRSTCCVTTTTDGVDDGKDINESLK